MKKETKNTLTTLAFMGGLVWLAFFSPLVRKRAAMQGMGVPRMGRRRRSRNIRGRPEWK